MAITVSRGICIIKWATEIKCVRARPRIQEKHKVRGNSSVLKVKNTFLGEVRRKLKLIGYIRGEVASGR